MAKKSAGVLLNVQTLRAVAVMSVALFHLWILLPAAGLPTPPASGVDLFFVISGFIMVQVTIGKEVSGGVFALNRITRIVPLYWLFTGLQFLVALALPSLLNSTKANPVWLAKSLFFIPFQKGEGGPLTPLLGVGWTLNYEMLFYGLFALSLAWLRKPWCYVAVVTALVGLVVWNLLARPAALPLEFLSRPIVLEFALGMAAAGICRRLKVGSRVPLRGALALTALVSLGLLFHTWSAAVPRVVGYGIPAFLLVCSLVILEKSGRVFCCAPVKAVGDASYSIYLTHNFITTPAQNVVTTLHLDGPAAFGFLLLTLAVIVVVGVLTHRYLEEPLTRVVGRALGVRPARAVLAPTAV